MNNIKPKFLKDGSVIGVVAPASPCEYDKTEKYCRMLSECGYTVIPGESCFSHHGYLAGSDITRANDINSMFADDCIDAIFCLRGGYGSSRTAEFLDLKMISKHPKIFLGFSDITVLHSIFNHLCGFVTFHGPSVSNCEWGTDDYRYRECVRILKGGDCILQGKYCYNYKPCEGIICGGNLTLVESLIGTKYEPDITDKILILEDVGEKNYSTDRRLTHLRQAGYFKKCKAVIIGSFSESYSNVINDNLPLRKIIEEVIVPSGKPVLFDAEFGHIRQNPTIPLGTLGKLEHDTLFIPSAVSH